MHICPACLTELSDDIKTCTKCGYGSDSTLGSDETTFAPQEEAAVSVNTVIDGRYQVVRELGRGGMGFVYLVKDTRLLDRRVALKMIHPSFVRHGEARKRFEQEVSTSLDLLHTNIIRVHHLASNSDQHYFTMEYVEGKSLREHIDERKQLNQPFSLAESLAIINPLLDALSYAHKYTIHRDIKPENIMVSGEFPDVQVKILDFGIAKTLSKSRLTQTAQSMGTAYYMAPEQMIGAREIDQRADLYSVGMILYEMLTLEMAVGRFKLPGELIAELPPWLDDLAEKLLAPRPDDRYQRAAEVKAALTSMGLESARQEEEQKAEEERESTIRELLAQGDTHLKHCRWSEAEETFARVSTLFGFHDEASAGQGKASEQKRLLAKNLEAASAAERAGDLKQAINILEESLTLSPDKNGIMERQAGLQKRLKERDAEEKRRREQEAAEEKLKAEESRKRAEGERQRERQRHPEEVPSRRAQTPVAEKKSSDNVFSYLIGGLVVLIVILSILAPLMNNRQEPDSTIPPATTASSSAPSFASPVKKKAAPGQLYVETEPASATVKILNIKKQFQQGMELSAGLYKLEVSAPGYVKSLETIEVASSETVRISRQLVRVETPVVAPSAPPAPVQSQAVQPVAPPAPASGQGAVSGIEMVTVPGGCYQMGDIFGDGGPYEKPVHEVCVDGFKIGKYEVTQGQWESVVGNNPSKFKKGDNYPVEQVSWDDVQQFIQRLNAKTGKKYRLPTEAEWEYAARSGGKQEKYSGGNDIDRVAWYDNNAGRSTHPVGTKAPNGLGIYDMSGNVWEWCQDRKASSYYKNFPRNNPQGPSSGLDRTFRGGSWGHGSGFARSANRGGGSPGDLDIRLGFRLVLPVQ